MDYELLTKFCYFVKSNFYYHKPGYYCGTTLVKNQDKPFALSDLIEPFIEHELQYHKGREESKRLH